MASEKTKLSELGTALGLVCDPADAHPEVLAACHVPGLAGDVWRPVVLGAAVGTPAERALLGAALANGWAFRRSVLRGRRPDHVEWSGGNRQVWTSDIPRDLTIDGVWFLQAKYDSTCMLNTAPAILVDGLLVDDEDRHRLSWYEEVAHRELSSYYQLVRAAAGGDGVDGLPDHPRDLDRAGRQALKGWMRGRPTAPAAEDDAYRELCRAVSIETVLRWRLRLRAATLSQQTQMLFRMLRIAGGPYWLLGTKGSRPVRLRVTDTRSWRQRFELRRFSVLDGHAGQPRVDWRAEVADHQAGARRVVEGYCEVRWSHGKLQGNPECKVQVATPLDALPGYEPMA